MDIERESEIELYNLQSIQKPFAFRFWIPVLQPAYEQLYKWMHIQISHHLRAPSLASTRTVWKSPFGLKDADGANSLEEKERNRNSSNM